MRMLSFKITTMQIEMKFRQQNAKIFYEIPVTVACLVLLNAFISTSNVTSTSQYYQILWMINTKTLYLWMDNTKIVVDHNNNQKDLSTCNYEVDFQICAIIQS